ncbi:PREDICTED: tigger transposable element-derived protein 7 [Miniopterus natalensis]|uniref:tigger transposable element-derived protein 7 n=1 Tax=Miniopterus natalensis TaxID=291302 RepID=UPI0007A6EE7C|nr:PREDICTED: tigger transposable element-derived protein 7 [Miniopterus natalensis]
MNKRGKYTTLNLEEKMKVLSRIEAGQSLKNVMDEFGISKSTFYDIKRNKKLILDFVLKQDMPLVGAEKRKRTTGAKYGDVDDAVYMWYQQKRSAGEPVRGVELQAAAERFAQCFGQTDFKASTGWLFRFRNRHAIGDQKVCTEQVLSSVSENEAFRQKLSMLIKEEKLCLAQLYSGDETDLFWKSVQENTQASRKDICLPGRKIHKEQLSALLCANADGTHKLKSIIIGKSKLPKNVKEDTSTLPVIYKPSKDVWFTRELFTEWFFQNFVPEVRHFQLNVLRFHEEDVRALLLLDNSPVHPSAESLTSEDGRIKCMFFPHTSTLIQPMNQGVILSCKQLYRWKQLEESLVIFEESDDEQDKGEKGVSKIKIYNIKSAVFNWANSWGEVKQTTIANAWENLLYRKEPEYDLQRLENKDYRQSLKKCGKSETKLDCDRVWLNGGDEEKGSPPKSKGGIIKEVVQKGGGAQEQNAEFKLSAVRKSLDYLLDFVDATPEFQKFHFTLKEMQQEIIKKQFQSRVHSRIGSFLKPRLHNIKDSFSMPSTSGSSN